MNIDFKKNKTMKWLGKQYCLEEDSEEMKEVDALLDGVSFSFCESCEFFMLVAMAYQLGMRQGKKRYIREHTKNQRRARNEDI